jgi:hypothetical protein
MLVLRIVCELQFNFIGAGIRAPAYSCCDPRGIARTQSSEPRRDQEPRSCAVDPALVVGYELSFAKKYQTILREIIDDEEYASSYLVFDFVSPRQSFGWRWTHRRRLDPRCK